MPVVLARLRPPRRPARHLRRPRLLDRLYQGLDSDLIAVVIPAGYGKTVLLADFAREVPAAVCWYSAHPDDADLTTFVEYLGCAIRARVPPFLPKVLAYPNGKGHEPRGLAAKFAQALAESDDEMILLVLDDFHLIEDSPDIAAFVDTLITQRLDHVRVALASRAMPRLGHLTSLAARGRLTSLDAADLQFRPDELRALWRRAHRPPLSEAEAEQWIARSGGWIAAINLLAGTGAAMPTAGNGGGGMYTYLASEVFAQLPAGLRDLLLATAVPDEFDVPLAAHLLGVEAPISDRLRELERRALFLQRFGTGRQPVYRYHHLFADFLRDRLRSEDPDRARALHARAADWYTARSDWPRAVRHRLATGDLPAAATDMDRHARAVYLSGQTTTLDEWARALATGPVGAALAPSSGLYHAKSLADRGLYDEAESWLHQIEPILRERGEREELANALITRGTVLRFRGQCAKILELVPAIASLLPEAATPQRLQLRRLEGMARVTTGQADEGEALLRQAADGFRALGLRHDLAEGLSDLGLVLHQRGDLLGAQAAFLEVLAIRRETGGTGLAIALNNLGYVHYLAGRYADAWRAYDEALAIATVLCAVRVAAAVRNGQGDLLCDLDEHDRAREAYEAARALAPSAADVDTAAATADGLSRVASLEGCFNDAFHWLREAAALRGWTEDAPAYRAALGAIHLEMGYPELAEAELRAALAGWGEPARPHEAFTRAVFHLARACHGLGQRDQAAEHLIRSLLMAAALGHDQFLVVAARRAPALVADAESLHPTHAGVRSLRARAESFRPGLGASVRPAPIASAPVRLEVLAFGEPEVRRGGELLDGSRWVSSLSRLLFLYLVEHGPARKEEIGAAFWPDATPRQVTSNFHSILWRVRHAVGGDAVVFEDGRYGLAPGVDLWYDVAEFERFVHAGQDARLAPGERAEAFRLAIDLYRGDYLAGGAFEWAEARREALRFQYARALLGAAGREAALRHWAEALALYERALALDPFDEAAHLGRMRTLLEGGAPAEALAHYREHERRLRREVGTEPAPPLAALAARARAELPFKTD